MPTVKISDCCKQIRGVSYKPEDLHKTLNTNSVTLFRANNINNGEVDFSDVVYVDRSCVSKEQYLKKGDILICASSGSKNLVGKAAQINLDGEYTFGAFCKVIRPQNINVNFLGEYFQSPIYRHIISAMSQGANINNIRNEHIDELYIPVFSESEQAQITQKLQLLTHCIRLYRQQLAKLDELVKSRFIEMFGGNKFATVHIEDICSYIVDCPHTTPKYQGKLLYPAIRTTEIKAGFIEWSTMKYVSQEEYEERISRLKPVAGDIVYGREGTYGNAAMLPDGYDFCLGQRVMLFRSDPKKCLPQYLLQALISDDVKRQADSKNIGSTVAHVNVADAKKFTVCLPPLALQNQFADFAKQADKSKLAARKLLERYELLRRKLMQDYFG